MHELSLVRALFRQVEELMRREGADRVVDVRVSVGEFSGVEPELLRSAYDSHVNSTAVRGAQLHLKNVPLSLRCESCGHEFCVVRFRFVCPECEDRQVTIVRGEGLLLESVTLEQVVA